jgi:hypothetical protein
MNMNEATAVNKFVKHFDIFWYNYHSFVKKFCGQTVDLYILHQFWNKDSADWYMGYMGQVSKTGK